MPTDHTKCSLNEVLWSIKAVYNLEDRVSTSQGHISARIVEDSKRNRRWGSVGAESPSLG